MLDIYAFFLIAAITIISSIFVFIEKKLIHAVAALSLAFMGSALLFFLLGQTFIALLQLIVFVGGLSTYLIVAVAAEEKSAMIIRLPVFFILAIALSAGLGLVLLGYVSATATNTAPGFLDSATMALQGSYVLFYIMAVLLFGVSISGVLIIRKFAKLVV